MTGEPQKQVQSGTEPPKRLLEEGSLWVMIAVPCVWAAQFLLSYWMAAVWCAKMAEGAEPIPLVRIAVGVFTVTALAAIGLLARHARRRYNGRLRVLVDLTEDSEPERTRFLGHAALLLCIVSAFAIVFTAMPALIFETCA